VKAASDLLHTDIVILQDLSWYILLKNAIIHIALKNFSDVWKVFNCEAGKSI
jgi:hypothetical protein